MKHWVNFTACGNNQVSSNTNKLSSKSYTQSNQKLCLSTVPISHVWSPSFNWFGKLPRWKDSTTDQTQHYSQTWWDGRWFHLKNEIRSSSLLYHTWSRSLSQWVVPKMRRSLHQRVGVLWVGILERCDPNPMREEAQSHAQTWNRTRVTWCNVQCATRFPLALGWACSASFYTKLKTLIWATCTCLPSYR